MKNNLKDRIRAASVGSMPKPKSVIVDLSDNEDEPMLVEVRQPTPRQRQDYLEKCRDEDYTVDSLKMQLYGVIDFTYVPGTDEKVYDEADFDAMANSGLGSFIDKISEVFVELCNTDHKNAKKS